MEDKRGFYYYQGGSGLSRSLRDGDFEESDVWDVLDEERDSGLGPIGYKQIEPSNPISRRIPSASTMIPRRSINGSSSSSNYSTPESQIFQQSAPVNVPNWSGITYKKNSQKGSSDWGNFGGHGYGSGSDEVGVPHATAGGESSDGDDGEEEDEIGNGSRVPPHELIARRLARSHISSLSVFEGVGRTLKGRDLSKVRNAVLTKTGFLESP